MKIYKRNPICYYFGDFNINCFKYCNVWYEYYEPKEFYEFAKYDIDMSWIEKNIYQNIDADIEMYYCVKDEIKTDREYTFVKCKVKINKTIIDGFLFIDLGRVNSLTVLIKDKEITFVSEEMLFYEENPKALKKLSKKLNIDLSEIKMIELIIDDKIKKAFSLNTSFQIADV